MIRRLFHRFVDPEAADADSQDCDYSLQVLRSRIALKMHDDWRRELVEAGELGQFFGVSLCDGDPLPGAGEICDEAGNNVKPRGKPPEVLPTTVTSILVYECVSRGALNYGLPNWYSLPQSPTYPGAEKLKRLKNFEKFFVKESFLRNFELDLFTNFPHKIFQVRRS